MADTSGLADAAESSKTARKQNVSCDACKFRKVKCDRRSKIESRQSTQNIDDIACTICSSHGLRCTFTQSAPRRRRGKRIVAIQKVQSHDVDESLALNSLQQSSPGTSNPYEPLFGTDVIVNEDLYDADTYAKNNVQTSDASKSYVPKEGLLGVRGLSRPLLDACIKSYFKYSAPCTPILHAEVYAARYALFFAQYDKNKGVGPFWERPKEDAQSVDRPLSELLLLSVGCIGAALLEPPIADFDSKAKFRLQDRLALKFQEAINKHDLLLRLQHEGTDVIEACYIMSDPMLTVLGDDLPSRSIIDWEAISQMDKSQRDPLRLRPASHEGIVRLIMKMGINQNPKARKDVPPGDDRLWDCDGVFIGEREVFRRSRIFWSIFMQDTFRAMGERRNVLIGNDDYDMDLPRFVPDGEGWFTAHFWHKTTDNEKDEDEEYHGDIRRLKASKFAKFDAFQFEVMLRLTFIIRTVSVKFVSPRSRSKGVLVTDVERAVCALTAWYQQLPHEVTWECQSEPLLDALYAGRKGSSNATAMRNSLRALFVESLYHSNVLAVWGSVDTFGTRSDIDILETVALLSGRLKINDDEDSTTISNSKDMKGRPGVSAFDYSAAPLHTAKAPEEIRRGVKQLLDHLTVRSFLRIPKLAKEAARLGLVRSHRGLFLNVFSLYAVWGCGLACKVAATGGEGLGENGSTLRVDAPPGCSQTEYIFKKVEDLIYSIEMVDSAEFVPMRVKQVQDLLQKSRIKCKEINQVIQSRRNSQSQSPLSTSAYSSSSGSNNDNPDAASPHDAPFRYYFKTGGRRGFSDLPSTAAVLKAPVPRDDSMTLTRDSDEVSMLAHQTVSGGFDSSPFGSLDRPSPTSSFQSGNTPDANKAGFTQDVNLDFDLESIQGMDTDWLHQYLQGGAPGWDATNQHPEISYQNVDATQKYHDNGQASMQQQSQQSMVNDAAAAQIFQSQANPFAHQSNASDAAAFVAPPAVLAGVDTQWDQFMANADAQLWADAQWQGFNVDSLMT